MLRAQSSDDLLYNLYELRPSDAIRSFRKSVIEDYPSKGCCYCGRKVKKWTLDHIIPLSKGGPTRRWNLSKCCSRCNGDKSNHDLLPRYRPKTFWSENRELTVFDWMKENCSMDSMITLETALRDGVIDTEALAEVTDATASEDFWERFCTLHPSDPECLIYEV